MASQVKRLAFAVDAALDALEAAVDAYVAEAQNLNREYMLANNFKPSPVYERTYDFLRSAVSSRRTLALALGLSVGRAGATVAASHPE